LILKFDGLNSAKETLASASWDSENGQKATLKGEATPNAGSEQRDEKLEQVNLGAQDDRWL